MKSAEEIKAYNNGEEESLEKVVASIAATGVNVLVCGQQVGELALHFLEKYKIMCLKVSLTLNQTLTPPPNPTPTLNPQPLSYSLPTFFLSLSLPSLAPDLTLFTKARTEYLPLPLPPLELERCPHNSTPFSLSTLPFTHVLTLTPTRMVIPQPAPP